MPLLSDMSVIPILASAVRRADFKESTFAVQRLERAISIKLNTTGIHLDEHCRKS